MTPCEIRAWRHRLGFSQSRAARELGVSVTAVKAWERGAYAPRSTVIKLMEALEASANLQAD